MDQSVSNARGNVAREAQKPTGEEKQIPPPRRSARGAQTALRGLTRYKSARKRRSGRFGPFEAQGKRDNRLGNGEPEGTANPRAQQTQE
jgi:hypothetical protein